jgi:starch synthase
VLQTSVGRITDQKVSLFRQEVEPGVSALDAILGRVARDGWLVVLGSGDPALERFFCEAMVRWPNLLFLRGYSDALSEALFKLGDVFLMPSSFEPCGISQMLAMRSGQPCVAHAVGGLKDTISPKTGFLFDGSTPAVQAGNFLAAVAAAIDLKRARAPGWDALQAASAAARFDWTLAAGRRDAARGAGAAAGRRSAPRPVLGSRPAY